MLAELRRKPSPMVDLALTLPLFLIYQIGVIFLHGVQNGTDLLTHVMLQLTAYDRLLYIAVTLSFAVAFSLVFMWIDKKSAAPFHRGKFIQVIAEGVLLAAAMRMIGAFAVGVLFRAGNPRSFGLGADLVLSIGAGFYEELAFRVILFGGGYTLLRWLLLGDVIRMRETTVKLSWSHVLLGVFWCAACAVAFSGVHYIGSLSDTFEARSFVFRVVLGVVLTCIYQARGFAVAVWTHAIYDIWVTLLQ